ncbi:IclR family transcriptional regulator [Halobacterium sp. KA-6]|uniref:IclR family transcriptional regulator n=1 Tax=Halobacterium sp. KA-6 TaxID=2896368 RepID=UPI001E2DA4B4|nr:IclR family transcriptional regulator [Halobacterium sp. KA-6]MCD2203666.1 IclR family transcriptional regulator [Halobacterium sp. KA-6]
MKRTANGDGGKQVESVRRAFQIIDALDDNGPMQLPGLAERLDMAESTVHVHLRTLQTAGYVVHNESGYDLSLRFLEKGIATRQHRAVYATAQDELDDLAEETGEVANLGVEESGQRVILDQSEGSDAVYDNAPIGEHTHMHWTALGKAILAELPVDEVEEIVESRGLPTATENTLSTREELFAALEEARERGYAIENEERRVGIRSVAVPIMMDSTVIGAISLSGPKERFSDQRIEDELVPALQSTSNIVEIRYNYE